MYQCRMSAQLWLDCMCTPSVCMEGAAVSEEIGMPPPHENAYKASKRKVTLDNKESFFGLPNNWDAFLLRIENFELEMCGRQKNGPSNSPCLNPWNLRMFSL